MNHRLLPRVAGQGLLATAEGFYHADRVLPFHVLIYVLEGVIYVTEEDTDYAVGPGEMLFLKSGLRHYGKTEIPRGTRWYYVHFALEESLALSDETFSTLTLPKKLTGLSGSSIERKLAAFVEACRSRVEEERWFLPQQLFLLLSHIALWERPERKPLDLSQRLADHLAAHAREAFSAKALEQAFFLSYKHMAAVFKKTYGQTMYAYHQRLRMEAAARLLRETLLPVGEISEQLGFGDQLYFSRCFHRHQGVSPTVYRRQLENY